MISDRQEAIAPAVMICLKLIFFNMIFFLDDKNLV